MSPAMWQVIGFVGQGIFASRFVVQWLASEQEGKSVMPIYFWYASIVGAALLLSYAIAIRNPVFILGQSFGMTIYLRNLILIRRRAQAADHD